MDKVKRVELIICRARSVGATSCMHTRCKCIAGDSSTSHADCPVTTENPKEQRARRATFIRI